MEQKNSRILYNHYGEENDLKIREVANVFNNKLRQINNDFDREITRIKFQKQIDKDLFLRSKFKLVNEKKRNLDSLKNEIKNDKRVLKQSLRDLQNISTMSSFAKHELKKIEKKIKWNAKYLDSSFSWMKKSADDPKIKTKRFNEIKQKCSEKEQEFFHIKNLLNFIYLTSSKQKISEEMNLFSKNHKDEIKALKTKLDKELKIIINKRDILKQEISSKQKSINDNFKIRKTELLLSHEAQIRELENEYNIEFESKKEAATLNKIKQSERLNNAKSKHKEFDSKIKNKKDIFISTQKQQIKFLKTFKKFVVFVDYANWNIDQIKKESKIAKINIDKKVEETLLIVKEINNDTLKAKKLFSDFQLKKSNDSKNSYKKKTSNINKKIALCKSKIKTLEKEIVNFANKNKDKNIKIKLSKHFGFLGVLEYKSVNKKLFSKTYDIQIAKELMEYSYEGDFMLKNSEAYIEFANDWINEMNVLNNDRRNSIITKNKINSSNKKRVEHNEFLKNKNKIKSHWSKELGLIKSDLKNKTITKKAFKQKKSEYKIFCKESIYEEKLKSSSKKAAEIHKGFKWRYFGKKRIWKKVYDSKIVENRRSIPKETFKNSRWIAMLLNLILPGSSELLMFQQFKKGIIMIVSAIVMYSSFLPFILGTSSEKFGGVFGLWDMGKSKLDWFSGIFPDARYYLLGGIISIFLLVGVLAFNISSSITAFKTGKAMEQGVRPMGWINTKRWLSNQGFPWMISLPGWILIIFVVVTPIITSLLLSFTNLGFNHEPPGKPVDWVRFEQYGKWWLFKDVGMAKSISRVIYWTILWTILSSSLVIVLGTFVAVLVNQNRIKFKKFWRIIYIIPWAIPAFVTIMFLKSAFQSDAQSLMNMVLLKLHVIEKPKDWMGGIWTVRIIIILIQGWLGHSYIFLLITGNMQSISKDIYEASEIDGANNNQMFKYMTLPILLSSIAPLLISQFTFAFNNFTIIALFTGGGPAFADPTPFLEGATDILISWIFKLTTSVAQIDGNMGFSAAMTMLAALISVGIASYGFAKSAAFRRY